VLAGFNTLKFRPSVKLENTPVNDAKMAIDNLTEMTLVIGNKNLSSWSLRPWLLMTHFELPFREVLIKLDTPTFAEEVARYSPSARVPVLLDGELAIWDSLAICEYVNERYLDLRCLPSKLPVRALARCVIAEMHSGFQSLRTQMPMNLKREPAPIAIQPQTAADIHRIGTLWRELLGRFGGPFLFAEFSMADCFFAPVATRFLNYGVVLGSAERSYVEQIHQLPALQSWKAAALLES